RERTRATRRRALALGTTVAGHRGAHGAARRGGTMNLFEWLPLSRARRTRELADEMRVHLEMAEADRVGRGESASDAAAGARREFGNVGLVLETSRDQWGTLGLWMER